MMRIVRKLLVPIAMLLIFALVGLLVPTVSHAQSEPNTPEDPCLSAPNTPLCQDRAQRTPGGDPIDNTSSPILGPSSILYKIIQTITVLTGALSVIMIVVGGFKYVVSGGDSTATKGAKDTILYAVIGLAIAIFAQTIITFVLSQL